MWRDLIIIALNLLRIVMILLTMTSPNISTNKIRLTIFFFVLTFKTIAEVFVKILIMLTIKTTYNYVISIAYIGKLSNYFS